MKERVSFMWRRPVRSSSLHTWEYARAGRRGASAGQVEGEVLSDLADDSQPFVKGESDHRSPHEPGVEQQTALTEEAAHDPQEHPRTGQFATVAGVADEPGNQRNRPALGDRLGMDDGGQGPPTLAPNVYFTSSRSV